MIEKMCQAPDCEKHAAKTGRYCPMHSMRLWKHGSLDTVLKKGKPRIPLAGRFWPKVDKTSSPHGCWLWTGVTSAGYGMCWVAERGNNVGTHRLAWEFARGPIPKGLQVCHNCPGGDNPLCVNPDHLFLGTAGDNKVDSNTKISIQRNGVPRSYRRSPLRRFPLVEAIPSAKLTAKQVVEIRTRYATDNVPQPVLAAEYGVRPTTISKIVTNRSWRS